MPQPPDNNVDPRPAAADSGGTQDSANQRSAGEGERSPAVSSQALDDTERETLRRRVQETEAWVERLKQARAEGTRLSQQQQYQAPPQQRQTYDEPRRPRTDVDHVVDVLNRGDDRSFVETVLETAERRALNRTAVEEGNKELVRRVTAIVDEHAPDVPMDLFWSYTEDAIRIAPNDPAKQVEVAIRLARRTLEQRDERLRTRRTTNENNRRSADTLDAGSGRGPRGTSARDDEKSTMVDDIRAYQASKR